MIVVMLCLWGSAVLGYVFRNYTVLWISRLWGYLVWLLLFLLGVDVGREPQLIGSLNTLGSMALLGAVFTIIGSGTFAFLFWRFLRRRYITKKIEQPLKMTIRTLWKQMNDCIVVIPFFVVGCILGYYVDIPQLPAHVNYYVLCLLMGLVGFNIGQNTVLHKSIREIDRRFLLLPLITILGTFGGIVVAGLFMNRYDLLQWLVVGSGFGYYSFVGIFVTEAYGTELGTFALLMNIFREVLTLAGAPLLYHWFGPLAPIAAGGCTTEDTTLPVIAKICGPEYVPISIFHGLVIDFAVPFFVTFFSVL